MWSMVSFEKVVFSFSRVIFLDTSGITELLLGVKLAPGTSGIFSPPDSVGIHLRISFNRAALSLAVDRIRRLPIARFFSAILSA
jgi:hypothetical protein